VKIFIIGASGYIGKPLAAKAAESFHVVTTSTTGESSSIAFDLSQPGIFDYNSITDSDVVLLAAAISSPDICAKQHDYAWRINVDATASFIEGVTSRGARVIFFSSDTVYGERTESFGDGAPCQPAGEYAGMKHAVERKFRGCPLFKSLRLSYVFSRHDKFTKYLEMCALNEQEAELFHPFYRSIIHRKDVVEAALALAIRWGEFAQQNLNFGGPDVLSRKDFAAEIQQHAFPTLRFRTTLPDDDFFLNRPRVIAMSSPSLKQLLGRQPRKIGEAVRLEFSEKK
jgi:dTDP-4-dehydrorhamnose reductase